MPDLRFGESHTTYEIVRCDRKTLGVVVSPDGTVVVRVPFNAASTRVTDFVDRLKPWIFKHLIRYQQACPDRKFVTGEGLPFLGKKYKLEVAVGGAAEPGVTLEGSRLQVTVSRQLSEEDRRNAVKRALIGWYKQQAQQVLPQQLCVVSARIGVSPEAVKVKHQARRWGSCTAKGVISLNWQLIMAPPEVIDYVVIHELCHLKVHNHQRGFWDLVARYQPDYKKLRKWLREKGRAVTFLSV
jgi:predicted metal-dependent hydrolase